MSKLSTAIRLIRSDKALFWASMLENFNFLFSDQLYLKLLFRLKMGYKLNLKNPKLFSEKIQWLKLHNRDPLYSKLVDKYAVKQYVSEKIGREHIIPTLGIWKNANEIDFKKLPNQFVLKTTNGGGGNVVICNEKNFFSEKGAVAFLNKCLKKNIYATSKEWPYKNVPSRIIAEKYMEDESGELNDYKFFCFNGEPHFCQVIRNRFVKETIDFYDLNWNHLPFVGLNPIAENGKTPVARPICLSSMVHASKVLAKGMPFVRIDYYVIGGQFFFGEMTFYPASGFGYFRPDEWNAKLGDLLNFF